MAIFIGIIVFIFIILLMGKINASGPVENWSDEKLERLIPTLIKTGNPKYIDKAIAAEKELGKRREQRLRGRGDIKTLDQLNDFIGDYTKLHVAAIQKIMKENNISFSLAAEEWAREVDKKVENFIAEGMTKDDAEMMAFRDLTS